MLRKNELTVGIYFSIPMTSTHFHGKKPPESDSERPCDGGIIIASTHHGTTEEKAENH